MNDKHEGYVFDIPYESHFYRDLNPKQIEAALWFSGLSLPKREAHEPLRYLELGYGQGMSLNINAATSQDEFWGTDFNPNHTIAAQNIARHSGTTCNFLNDSFEELYAKSQAGLLPQFDIIALHGVWSWISSESRDYILHIISRNLKVGGAVYISYNCMPGWANFTPLRDLLTYHAKTQNASANTHTKVKEAYSFASKLKDFNALYFATNPSATAKFNNIADKSISYIAHEYFNEDWYVPYFKDVATELEKAKCIFATSTRLLSRVDMALPAELRQYLAEIKDTNLRETVRDYALNTQFRTDIFVKGYMPRVSQNEQADNITFALCTHKEAISYEINVPTGKLQLKEEAHKPIIEFLASDNYKPKSIEDIQNALPDLNQQNIMQSIYLFFAANILHFATDAANIKDEQKDTSRRFNTAMLAQTMRGASPHTLASPVLGGGFMTNTIEILFLAALQQGLESQTERCKWVYDMMQKQGRHMKKEDAILSEEESITKLQEMITQFEKERLPLVQALNIELNSLN